MDALVTLDQAKKHLKRPLGPSQEDDDLEMKVLQAQALVLEYLSDSTDATWTATMDAWTDDNLPLQVQAAILLQLGDLYRYRGDGPDDTGSQNGDLATGVKRCLYRLRTPVVA